MVVIQLGCPKGGTNWFVRYLMARLLGGRRERRAEEGTRVRNCDEREQGQ